MKNFKEFVSINEAKAKFVEKTPDELKKIKESIRNYVVTIQPTDLKSYLMPFDVHVGLGSQNHYKTIVELVNQKFSNYPDMKIIKIEMDMRTAKEFSIGKKR